LTTIPAHQGRREFDAALVEQLDMLPETATPNACGRLATFSTEKSNLEPPLRLNMR
jgi:hypothetical protein